MPIRFTNTLTGAKEEFLPLRPPEVSLYVCGVTVYDDCHVGHARGAVVFDTLRRFLESYEYKPGRKYRVRHVRNVTDVDDKIIDRARREMGGDLKAAVRAMAERYTLSFQSDFVRLGLLSPSAEPKATAYIPKMVCFIEGLIRNGIAYEGSDGVYFSVKGLAARRGVYGELSHQRLGQMLESAHVDAAAGKQDPLDFALWKKAKPEEPSWQSPWGPGRPGWHIECTTMSTDLLGDTFDIHGGGQDLVFPHHENERAQALGAGKGFARIWLHNGLLTVNGQKMSKSLGNLVTIGEALKRHPADALRLFFLGSHYRSPADFTWERLDEAAHAYERLTAFLVHVSSILGKTQAEDIKTAQKDSGVQDYLRNGLGFYEALEDDFNTPKALASIYHLIELANRDFQVASAHPAGLTASRANACVLRDKIQEMLRTLGFLQNENCALEPEIQRLLSERDFARNNKDFQKSDQIRKELMSRGYVVEDTSGGTVVRRRV